MEHSHWAKTATQMNVSTKDSGIQLFTLIQVIQETKKSYKNCRDDSTKYINVNLLYTGLI